ncbi:hypothetical protein Hypma_011165 [Hypsizygus marmoreus]|uniref:Uncharacterized protein n=1 Tax=Hypsizygus marmoreus TaxID=39966 RepID=A0A369JQX4_HYPMA|nr:hypothetical protein Hypma_011165 [Hypsizygus marmoreus]
MKHSLRTATLNPSPQRQVMSFDSDTLRLAQ